MMNARGPAEAGDRPDRTGEACADDAGLRVRRAFKPAGRRSDRHATNASSAGHGHDAGAAAYIAVMAAELAQLARASGHDTLGYLLEMAELEAGQCARSHF
jgi:hypothetical protein